MPTVPTKSACLFVALLATACVNAPPVPLEPDASASRLETRSLADPALRDFLAKQLGHPIEPWPRSQWGLEDLTLAGLFFHPSVRVARADLEVARAHQGTAAQRPNPTLSILPQRVANPTPGVPPWLAVFDLNWTIETGGKREHRRSVAAAQARAAAWSLATVGWQVRGELALAAASLRAAERRLGLHAELRELLEQRVAALEHRVRAGAATEIDLARDRLALLQGEADLATARRLRQEARARLASALGISRSAFEGVELLDGPDAWWTDASTLDSLDARRAALLGRSDVLASLADYDAAEANLRLQLAQQIPNLQLGPGYEYDQGSHKWGIALALELPLLSQNQGAISEALAARAQAAARFELLQSRVIADVDAATASLEGARIEREHASGLLRETEHTAELTCRATHAGASDRMALLDAQLAATQARLIAVDADEQWELAFARLEQAVRPAGTIAPSTLAAGGAP